MTDRMHTSSRLTPHTRGGPASHALANGSCAATRRALARSRTPLLLACGVLVSITAPRPLVAAQPSGPAPTPPGATPVQPSRPAPSAPPAPPATEQPAAAPDATKPDFRPFEQEVPSAAFKFEMIPVPGDESKGIRPFWIGKTELTWEAFDVFVYRLDEGGVDAPLPAGADASTRPTKPYLPPDRGFGHEGYAAISLSLHNATMFCEWLSQKSGKHYRLPTEDEWEHACRAGGSATAAYFFGDDASTLGEYAWFADNSEESPHPVATKKPNAWGLYDMHGNVGEWVISRDGKRVVKGGRWDQPAEKLRVASRDEQDRTWNSTDPQIPKSKWWLSDGSFIGFRVVCDPEPRKQPANPEKPELPGRPNAPTEPKPKP